MKTITKNCWCITWKIYVADFDFMRIYTQYITLPENVSVETNYILDYFDNTYSKGNNCKAVKCEKHDRTLFKLECNMKTFIMNASRLDAGKLATESINRHNVVSRTITINTYEISTYKAGKLITERKQSFQNLTAAEFKKKYCKDSIVKLINSDSGLYGVKLLRFYQISEKTALNS